MKKILVLVLALVVGNSSLLWGAPLRAEKNWIIKKIGGVFKLIYDNPTPNPVDITIYDLDGRPLFSERVKVKNNGFIRPYNLEHLPEGDYRISVTDEDGERNETVSSKDKPENNEFWAHVMKLRGQDCYLVAVPQQQNAHVEINIYNENNRLVYSDAVSIENGYASLFRLKEFNGSGSIHIKNLETNDEKYFDVLGQDN